jgi:hypothetical protein
MFTADSHSSGVESMRGYTRGSRFRASVRRLAAGTALGVALLALVGAPGALAAAPQLNRFHDVGTDVDPNFCDTGQTIDIAFDVRGREWFAPHRGDYKLTAVGTVTFTNPDTADVVIQHFTNPLVEFVVSEGPGDLVVVETHVKGLPELFKTPHGGVLTRDAGYIVLRSTFDGDELIDQEILVDKGPHPQAESDFELFCEIMPEALGIES